MNAKLLEALLKTRIPSQLASDLISQFVQIRQDIASLTLGRSAPGKFVETVVQSLQYIEQGTFDLQPKVDDYLKNIESRSSILPDGLRICVARVARAMYTLRNKRNILHKGEVDPNEFDLRFLLSGAQWIMAEFVREFSGATMQQAGLLVNQIQAPINALVEDIGSRKIVHGNLTAKEEILVLLQRQYPSSISVQEIVQNLDRRNADAVKKSIRELWSAKLIDGSAATNYLLTIPGLQKAMAIIKKATS